MINLNDNMSRGYSLFFCYVVPLLVIAFVAYVRIHLLDVPLERDEGEYAYVGQLLLKGIPPYLSAYSMKLPGVGMVYAIIMLIFGQTPFGIHLGLLIINFLSIGLLWLLARQLSDTAAAGIAASAYAILSLSQGVYGVFAHATHFVVLFAVAGCVLMHIYLENNRRSHLLVVSGLCFGLAVIMKQHAALIVLFAFSYLLWRTSSQVHNRNAPFKESLFFLAGVIAPFGLVACWMALTGVFERFWFWTVSYPRAYVSSLTLSQGFEVFKETFPLVAGPQILLWVWAVIGAIFLFVQMKTSRLFLAGFLLSSFLAVCPGFYFREHYFVMLLPAIALLVGIGVTSTGNLIARSRYGRLNCIVLPVLVGVTLLYGIYNERDYFFTRSPLEVSRSIYGDNPFPESIAIARYLREHTVEDDRIAVLGSEPQIYFYANRLSASGHIYMYGLMENHPFAGRMQQEMIREVEEARPRYLVMIDVHTSWLRSKDSPQALFNWADTYINAHYQMVGIADINANGTGVYFWDGTPPRYQSGSKSFITIWKRIN